MAKGKRVNVYLSYSTLETLELLKKVLKISKSELINKAVGQYKDHVAAVIRSSL